MLDSIKRKIKALLSKTESNGCTKAEAELALKKAMELMAEYMIEEHELKDTKDRNFIKKMAFVVKSKIDNTMFAPSLCDLFNTEHFYIGGRGAKDLYFFGLEQDVECCIYFFNMLQQTLFNESILFRKTDEFYKASRVEGPNKATTDFQKGFLQGVVINIHNLVKAKQEKCYSSTGTDLVVVKNAEVEEAFNKEFPNIKEKKTSKDMYDDVNYDSWRAGRKKGEEVNFSLGINKNETKGLR